MKILSIINPVSGRRKAISVYEQISMEKYGFIATSYITEYPGHATQILSSISLDAHDAIVVFGGDGTIHEVVNGLMSRSDGSILPIGIVPLGTGNALMHDLDILTVEKALETISEAKTLKIDLLKCTTPTNVIYAFNMLGWGIAETINKVAERSRWLGKQRYNVASLIELLKNPSWKCKIILDESIIDDKITFFMANNTQYTGNGMRIAPQAILNDGMMDVIVLTHQPRYKLLRLFLKVFSGHHVDHPEILYQKVRKIRIEPAEVMPLIIDGQQTGFTPIEISILSAGLEIFFNDKEMII